MFQALQKIEPDGLIALIAAFKEDPRSEKIDLGVGVYQDKHGRTPVMTAVKTAEQRLLQTEESKSYQGMAGDLLFNERICQLTLGDQSPAKERLCVIHTPGGSGALRVAAEVILKASPDVTVWVSTPTWVNHIPLMSSVGLSMREYPYYDPATHGVDFAAMMDALQNVAAGDVVVLHGCCHNPSGVDLSHEQWRALTDLALQKGFIPLIDMAYQGLGDGIDQDAFGARLMAERLPELMVTVSCSKNFGLYRERTGAAIFVSQNAGHSQLVSGQAMAAARRLYSMPPAHGAAVVAEILGDKGLRADWMGELDEMRGRIVAMRALLVEQLADRGAARDFSFIARQKGMFSFLGITPQQVRRLRDEFAIYMAASSRINVAGMRSENIGHLAQAICALD